MLLGCIGDDFTGSSDLGVTLAKGGMRVTQYVGVPDAPAAPEVEAGVIALKSRTIPAAEAVRQSLAALEWLIAQGCRQFMFKYCSTFDSTDEGNIGPVTEALMDRLGADRALICPAFPATGRTVYAGHLFVGDRLLSESGMRDHPLTPMRDPDIRRCLARQSRRPVGHVGLAAVMSGEAGLRAALDTEVAAGRTLIVVDAVRDEDLRAIGRAGADLTLFTGGSGIGLGLPDNFRRLGLLAGGGTSWRGAAGPGVIVSGSCSEMTRSQIARHQMRHPAQELDIDALMRGDLDPAQLADWALRQDDLPLIYSSADPARVEAVQDRYGRDRAATAIEGFFAHLARHLVAGGVRRLISAGGETSGAVVSGLGLRELEIGPEIAPGVPALRAGDLVLALKSGNFGGPDFFTEAATMLGDTS